LPRVDHLSTNFSGGELSPRLYGRSDLQKYNDAVKRARDVVLMQHGGATRRPGTDWLGEVKDSSKATRVIPFVYSRTDSFVVEMGDNYLRFWKDGALLGGPYEVVTTYGSSVIFDIDYAQGADTMFLAHPSFAPRRLRRFSDTRWVFDTTPLDPGPFDEIGMRHASVITLGAVTGSTTATSAASLWLAADVGRVLTYQGGAATISAYTSAAVVDVTIATDFGTTTLPSNGWLLSGSPKTALTPGAANPVGTSTTLVLGADGWRTADIGKHVVINGGLMRITAVADAINATGVILAELTSATAAPSDAWSLEDAVWNAVDGYPSTVTLHEQRLVSASTSRFPQRVWGSRPGLVLDFTKGALDDDGYSHELATDEINPILFLSSFRDLAALTYAGEWTLLGGVEKPITPTNVRARQHSKAGAQPVRPEQVDDDLYYAQRGGKVLRALGYRIDLAGYVSEEASTLSEHITSLGIEELSYQQSPERVLWLRLSDGSYAAVTLSREQNIRAFSLCAAAGGGVVESMATVPEGEEDVTYMIVRRTIDGATKRYVERMNWEARQDCRITSSPASATVSGLDHLEGKTVCVVADGVDIGNTFVVSGGEITLPRVAASVSVGLRYTPTLVLLEPEIGTGAGASAGRDINVSQIRVRFQDTIGCTANDSPISFRSTGENVLDTDVEPYSGWKTIGDLGWGTEEGEIELKQPQAYPWTILAVVRRTTANPG